MEFLRSLPILLMILSGLAMSKPQSDAFIPTTLARSTVNASSASRGKELVDLGVLPDESGSFGISRSTGRVTLTSRRIIRYWEKQPLA